MHNSMRLLKKSRNNICKVLLMFVMVLFLPFSANAYIEDCTTTVFSDGLAVKPLTFPAGGGYNNEAKVSLPMSATITTTTVDLVPKTIIKTPYIWIPNTVSGTVAQLRTKDGTLVKLYQDGADGIPGGSLVGGAAGISRITVIPGGDVYIANRASQYIIRLKPKAAPSEEYEYGGRLDMGLPWIRAVTFDKRGYVWGATCGNAAGTDRVRVFCGSGTGCGGYDTILATLVNGKCHYGAIADKYGFTWTVGSAEIRSYSYNSGVISEVDTDSVPDSYGIGIDNNQNLWVGKRGPAAGVHKVTRNNSGFVTGVATFLSGLTDNTGVAADGLGNVWVDGWGTNQASKFSTAGALIANYPAGGNPHGAAIDFDNNAWLVNYLGGAPGVNPVLNPSGCAAGAGSVTVYKADGTYVGTYTTCGNNPYNYSDMTGFRSIPNSLSVGSTEYMPTTGNTYTGFGAPLKAALTTCSCVDAFGVEQCSLDLTEIDHCLIPLSLFSVSGGDYDAKNLIIGCSVTFPDLTTGLVPCGRISDNTATGDIDESQPCSLCAGFYMLKNVINFVLELAIGMGVFILVVAGLLYALSAGNSRNIDKAKAAITSAIIGIAIIFVAWLIIAVILQAMGYANMTTWNQVNCIP